MIIRDFIIRQGRLSAIEEKIKPNIEKRVIQTAENGKTGARERRIERKR